MKMHAMTSVASPARSERHVQLRRAVIASSTVTGLVLAKLFFPNSDPLVGRLEAFAATAMMRD
jgi:hypothetical protein